MLAKENIVLPTRWAAEVLQHRSQLISNLLGEQPLSIDSAIRMVHVALEEILLQRRQWINPGVFRYHSILEQSDVGWVMSDAVIRLPELTGDEETITVHDAFNCIILNGLINEIENNLLNPHYPERSFELLEAVQLSNGDTILRNLGDYRIWRLEQLVREGKVTY